MRVGCGLVKVLVFAQSKQRFAEKSERGTPDNVPLFFCRAAFFVGRGLQEQEESRTQAEACAAGAVLQFERTQEGGVKPPLHNQENPRADRALRQAQGKRARPLQVRRIEERKVRGIRSQEPTYRKKRETWGTLKSECWTAQHKS